MWEEGSTKCVLRIIDLFFLAMLHNNRKKSLLLGLTHFTPTQRINGHFSKGMVIWICIFSFTLLHCINYNCLELPGDSHICTFHYLKAFWLQKVLSTINPILQITKTDSSEARWCGQWYGNYRAVCALKILRKNIYKIFGLLLTSWYNANVQVYGAVIIMCHSRKGTGVYCGNSFNFCLWLHIIVSPKWLGFEFSLCHLGSRGEPWNGKQRGDIILCQVRQGSHTGFTQIRLICQTW